jgi:hypothetical protein
MPIPAPIPAKRASQNAGVMVAAPKLPKIGRMILQMGLDI